MRLPSWGPIAASTYRWQLPLERPALRAAIDLVDPKPNDRLLDIATGTAEVLRLLATRFSRPLSATGIDSSDDMLSRAVALPAGWNLERADARSLRVSDGSYDVVIIAYLIHFLDQRSRGEILGEAARVLAPGGRLVTITPTRPGGMFGRLAPGWPCCFGAPWWPATLRGLDPTADLRCADLTPIRALYLRRGYPSLCVLAKRAG